MKATTSRERGMAVIAVIVLITVLFLGGTAMALAVSSNLRTVDILRARDAVHYAAESAVARGVAAAAQTPSCSLQGGPINGLVFTARCEPPLDGLAGKSLKKWSVPGGPLLTGCHSYPLLDTLEDFKAVWTVVGWRNSATSAAVTAWIDGQQSCNARPPASSVSPAYVSAKADQAVLHIAVDGSAVDLAGYVIRAAKAGADTIVTVVGSAGGEVDEADTVLPAGGIKFWNTVLP
jgi:hypothetical protein